MAQPQSSETAEISDDLNAPLGRKRASAAKRPRLDLKSVKWPVGWMLFGAVFVLVGGVTAWVALVDDPSGGRPSTAVPISAVRDTNEVARDVSAPATETPMIIGEQFPAGQTPGEQVAETLDPTLADRELNEFGAYPQLLEQTQHGPVPHIGVNGERPFDAYARASLTPASANGQPLIAIIVTGLGLNETATLNAISKLPDNITLAFAPYGDGLQRAVASAQAEGHEFWLEVPMEPFDYPDSDPGPHTLLVNQPVRSNLDRLIWLMARFGGYAGVINNLGARFTSTAADFSPIMEEIGTRGLGYVDDGSSNRSLARQLAGANQVPFARADENLDATPSRTTILAALTELKQTAEAHGSAVGVISALPVSIDTLAAWAAEAENEGVQLVPVSALMKGE